MKHNKNILLFLALASLLVSCGEASSLSTPESTSVDPDSTTYHFYAINDFHGAVVETDKSSYLEGGLARVGKFLKDKKAADPDHTFIISAGDMWQGSLESNNNYGELVTKGMNEIGFDAMSIGNHEFDYGVSYITANAETANFPFLAGNIVKWDDVAKQPTTTLWDAFEGSTVIERGGHKIGIIGMIGEGETTSILSSNVSDLYFANPISYIRSNSIDLKTNQGCDIVVLALHADASTLGAFSDIKDYVDGVFTGHTHVKNDLVQSGVPMVQAYSNGSSVSSFDLKLTNTGTVTCTSHGLTAMSSSYAEDENLLNLEEQYIGTTAFKSMAARTCGTVSGSFSTSRIANAGCKAIYETVIGDYPEVCCAMMNSQRDNVNAGVLTYSRLYKSTPFMNKIIILKARGSIIKAEGRQNSCYTGDLDNYGTLDDNTVYTCAVIDYVAIHQNVNKQYNYFSDFNAHPEYLLATINSYPVDILFDYWVSLGSGTITSTDYSGTGYNVYQ